MKNPSTPVGIEPANLGSRGEYDNHWTTGVDWGRIWPKFQKKKLNQEKDQTGDRTRARFVRGNDITPKTIAVVQKD